MSKDAFYAIVVAFICFLVGNGCTKSHSKTPLDELKHKDTSKHEVSFLFIGDIMQHGPQIRAAFIDSLGVYDYNSCFAPIAPIAKATDFTVANLELTLAGEPYSGYPQFSAPDALANALQTAGINYLVTANNHSCDRGKNGIVRTVNVLDSLGIARTGTFADSADRVKNNVLWFDKHGIKVALLNYTYGTNGIPIPAPTVVNLIDSALIKADIATVKKGNPDKIIVFTHWGDEYQSLPNAYQKQYAKFILAQGVDYIIGSHPHVLQPMERFYDSALKKEQIVVYSLGNFVSNQRERYKDGGAMFKLVLKKDKKSVEIAEAGYFLTWVDKVEKNGKNSYTIYPAAQYQNDSTILSANSLKAMQQFTNDSKQLFNTYNNAITEYTYSLAKGGWLLPVKK